MKASTSLTRRHRQAVFQHDRWYNDFGKFYVDYSPKFSDFKDDAWRADMDDGSDDDEEEQRYMPDDDPDIFGEMR